jgi:hypothetical protein
VYQVVLVHLFYAVQFWASREFSGVQGFFVHVFLVSTPITHKYHYSLLVFSTFFPHVTNEDFHLWSLRTVAGSDTASLAAFDRMF